MEKTNIITEEFTITLQYRMTVDTETGEILKTELIKRSVDKENIKAEFFLPSAVAKRISEQKKTVSVLETDEKWYGVTYREDAVSVKNAMTDFINRGMYKF